MSPFLKTSLQVRGLGRSLLIILLLIAGLGQLRANFNVKITNVVLPIQQYAAIDLSGSVPGNNNVNMVALDDGNNAAFEFSTSTQPFIDYFAAGLEYHTWASEAGILYSYTWKNGISGLAQSKVVMNSGPTLLDDMVSYGEYYPTSLTASSGIMTYGSFNHSFWYDGNNIITADNPFTSADFAPFSQGSIATPFQPNLGTIYSQSYDLAVSPNGKNIFDEGWLWADDNGDDADNNDGEDPIYDDNGNIIDNDGDDNGYTGFDDFVYINGHYTSFDANNSYIPSNPGNVTLISQSFVPNGINDNGWAIGVDTSPWQYTPSVPNTLLWNGGSVVNLGFGYPSGINNQNQIIADAYDANWNFLGGYLWDNGPQTALWDVLPKMTQHQYSAGSSTTLSCTIAPYSLSNQKNPATNGGITDTSIQILSTASNPVLNTNENLLFQRDNTGTKWSTFLQQFPTNVSIIGNPAVNSSGVGIARGTIVGGNGIHALLMTPVSPAAPTLYMFSGHDSDTVNLATANCPGWTYQWKLASSNSSSCQGQFENYGTTSWSTTGTTNVVTFRPGVAGTGNVAGDTRQQSPGSNTIQLWINGTLTWEKPIVVIQILPRSSWGALPANTSSLAGMPGINQFTVHHSSKEAFGITEIQRIQKEHMGLLNGTTLWYTANPHDVWGDIGYHFILDPSNDSDTNTVLLYEGRQLEGLGLTGGQYTVPAAVKLKNTLSGIDICMLGNYQTGTWASWMLGSETFSETRRKKLEMVLTALSFRYQTPATLTASYSLPPVTSPPISFHQQLAEQGTVYETTECPGSTVISTMSTTQNKVQNDLK